MRAEGAHISLKKQNPGPGFRTPRSVLGVIDVLRRIRDVLGFLGEWGAKSSLFCYIGVFFFKKLKTRLITITIQCFEAHLNPGPGFSFLKRNVRAEGAHISLKKQNPGPGFRNPRTALLVIDVLRRFRGLF